MVRSLALKDAVVALESAAFDWSAAAVERLTSGRVDYVLLLSGSSVPQASQIEDALSVLRQDPTTAAVGPSLTGAPTGSLELAVSGHCLLARAVAIRSVGGFDPALGGSLDDVGLCMRLWAAGHRVRSISVPGVVARGEGADPSLRSGSLMRSLATVLEDEDLQTGAWSEPDARVAVSTTAGARRYVGGQRRRGTGELVPLIHAWFEEWSAVSTVGAEAASIVRRLAAPDRAGTSRRILVVTTDVLAPAMAGPAIRAVAIARELAREHDVTLVSTEACTLDVPGVDVALVDDAELARRVDWCDILVFQGWVMAGRPWIRDSSKIIVADIYDPMQLEQLEQAREAPGELGRSEAVRSASATMNEQIRRADFMLCASQKQRDLWVGVMTALGRINPVSYDEDPSFDRYIGIAPFGVSDDAFPTAEPGDGAIKGRVDGIGADDRVVLWGGGVYNWFDPLTLVRAIDQLRSRLPSVRLYFLGLSHPNPAIPTMRMAYDLRQLADELGLVGSHVFFNDGWVRYDERWRYLADADVGVSTHLEHIETEFSFRTRILDYLWASLPVVATGGDAFASLIEDSGAGRTVPPGDVDALAGALEVLLTDEAAAMSARKGSKALADQLRWASNLTPLVEFCRSPRRAPDVACPTLVTRPEGAELERGLRRDLRVAMTFLRAGGVEALRSRVAGRLRRRFGER